MKILLATAVVLLAVGLTGCDDSSEAPSADFLDSIAPTAVVKGRLVTVDIEGKNPKPSAGTVILTGKSGAKVSDEVATDGRFEVSVVPGDYQVTGTSPQPDGGTAQCAAREPTTVVSADTPTVVDVLCFVQ